MMLGMPFSAGKGWLIMDNDKDSGNTILFESILDELRSNRTDMRDISINMVNKKDFSKLQDKIEENFDKTSARITVIENKTITNDLDIKKALAFRDSMVNGFQWFTRAAIVAGLGIIAALIPYHFGVAMSQNVKPESTTPPVIISTPSVHFPTPAPFSSVRKIKH